VVICADALDVHRLSEELPYFEPVLTVRAFPDWETLPYDILSPHPDLASERIETLYRLMTRQPAADTPGTDVLLVAAGTATQRLAPPSFVAARTFWLRQGQRIDVEQLRSQLALAGYHAVSQVSGPASSRCAAG